MDSYAGPFGEDRCETDDRKSDSVRRELLSRWSGRVRHDVLVEKRIESRHDDLPLPDRHLELRIWPPVG